MKTKLYFLFTILAFNQFVNNLNAQDTIYLPEGQKLKCKILDINELQVGLKLQNKNLTSETYLSWERIQKIILVNPDESVIATDLSAEKKQKIEKIKAQIMAMSSIGASAGLAIIPSSDGGTLLMAGIPIRINKEKYALNFEGYFSYVSPFGKSKSYNGFLISGGPDFFTSKKDIGNTLKLGGVGFRVGYGFMGEHNSYYFANFAYTLETFKFTNNLSSTLIETGLGIAHRPSSSETVTEQTQWGTVTTTTEYYALTYPYLYIRFRMSLAMF